MAFGKAPSQRFGRNKIPHKITKLDNSLINAASKLTLHWAQGPRHTMAKSDEQRMRRVQNNRYVWFNWCRWQQLQQNQFWKLGFVELLRPQLQLAHQSRSTQWPNGVQIPKSTHICL